MKKKNKVIFAIISILILIAIVISCLVANFILSNKAYYKDEKNIFIPIFLYHDIVTEKIAEDYMQTTDAIFKKQITGLQKLGYEFINYDDLIKYNNGEKKLKSKVCLITFDDGLIGNYNILFPLVKELNIPITINIIDSEVGLEGYLSWDQIKEMYASNLINFHSHGKFHSEPFDISTEEYVQQITNAHAHIEENLGETISKVYTYPYGLFEEDKVEALAAAGFVQNLTDNKINKSNTLDLSRLHRAYPLSDSVFTMIVKLFYRSLRY